MESAEFSTQFKIFLMNIQLESLIQHQKFKRISGKDQRHSFCEKHEVHIIRCKECVAKHISRVHSSLGFEAFGEKPSKIGNFDPLDKSLDENYFQINIAIHTLNRTNGLFTC